MRANALSGVGQVSMLYDSGAAEDSTWLSFEFKEVKMIFKWK
jgi:hypothetical protein